MYPDSVQILAHFIEGIWDLHGLWYLGMGDHRPCSHRLTDDCVLNHSWFIQLILFYLCNTFIYSLADKT